MCAHVCSHNDRCEVCDDGGEALLPCDYCNLAYHTGCLAPPLIIAKFAASARRATTPRRSPRTTTSTSECFPHNASTSASRTRRRPSTARRRHHDNHTLIHVPHTRSQHHYHNKKLTAQNPFLCVLYLRKTSSLSITVSFACYYRITRRRSGAGPPRNAHCVYYPPDECTAGPATACIL